MENNFLSLIKTRRSVRAYKSEFVPSEALDAVLEAGTYAPTGGGHQSPTIIAITDPKYRKEIAKLNAEVMGSNTDPYYGAPVVILVLADGSASTFVEDGSCVLENMMLAAHALGLAAPEAEDLPGRGGCAAPRAENFPTRNGRVRRQLQHSAQGGVLDEERGLSGILARAEKPVQPRGQLRAGRVRGGGVVGKGEVDVIAVVVDRRRAVGRRLRFQTAEAVIIAPQGGEAVRMHALT